MTFSAVKLRNAQLQKILPKSVVGAREVANRQVALPARAGGEEGAVEMDAFVNRSLAEIRARHPIQGGSPVK